MFSDEVLNITRSMNLHSAFKESIYDLCCRLTILECEKSLQSWLLAHLSLSLRITVKE